MNNVYAYSDEVAPRISVKIIDNKKIYTDSIMLEIEVIEDLREAFSGIKDIYYFTGENKHIIYSSIELQTYYSDKICVDVDDIEGDSLEIFVSDRNNNISSYKIKNINIDNDPPKIKFNVDYNNLNILNNKAYTKGLKISYEVTDKNLDKVYIADNEVTKEGNYIFVDGSYNPVIKAIDKTGKITEERFLEESVLVVDSKLPKVLSNIASNDIFNKNAELIVEVEEENLDESRLDKRLFWQKEEDKYVGKLLLSEEKNHDFEFSFYDLSNNVEKLSIKSIIIDKTPPEIIINNYRKIMNNDDFIKIFSTEDYKVIISRNDTIISAENNKEILQLSNFKYGKYNIRVISIDKAGNKTEVNKEFQIPKKDIDVECSKNLGIDKWNKTIKNIGKIKITHPYDIFTKIEIYRNEELIKELNYSNKEVIMPKENFIFNGSYRVDARFTDIYGIEKFETIAKFNIDDKAPIIDEFKSYLELYDNMELDYIKVKYKDNSIKLIKPNDTGKIKLEKEGIVEVVAFDLAKNISKLTMEATNNISKKLDIVNEENYPFNTEKFLLVYSILYFLNFMNLYMISHKMQILAKK